MTDPRPTRMTDDRAPHLGGMAHPGGHRRHLTRVTTGTSAVAGHGARPSTSSMVGAGTRLRGE